MFDKKAEEIFKSFLLKLAELREMTDRKIIAFMVGDFELAKRLEQLSREDIQFTKIHALKLEGDLDADELLIKIRELKFEEDEAEIVLLAGGEILLQGNIRALADYTVAVQYEKNISSTVNEVWQMSDGNLVKLEDDEELAEIDVVN